MGHSGSPVLLSTPLKTLSVLRSAREDSWGGSDPVPFRVGVLLTFNYEQSVFTHTVYVHSLLTLSPMLLSRPYFLPLKDHTVVYEWTRQCLWGRQFQGEEQHAVSMPTLDLALAWSRGWSG